MMTDSAAAAQEGSGKPISAPLAVKLIVLGVVVAMGSLAALLWLKAPEVVPDVAFTSLKGQKQRLADLQGKVVLVNFWATSCVTCVSEMPKMVETYQKYHTQGYEMIAVAMSYDRPDYVVNFAETRQLPFTVALDTQGDIARRFGDIKLTPTTILIDRQGRIVRRYVGEPDFRQFHTLIEKALKG